MGWVSPTGFVDPDVKWKDEYKAYDEDSGTFARLTDAIEGWGAFLELTHAAINCDKLRYWAAYIAAQQDELDLDVYYGGAWHDVYQGSGSESGSHPYQWVEKSLGGTYSVTAARIRFHHPSAYIGILYEFEFNEVEVVGRSHGYIIG